MDEAGRDFHTIALKSILFKGRADWYFCYLKAEKIAQVLGLLAQASSVKDKDFLQDMVAAAARLPHMIAHFVAGEVEAAVVLADIFSLLSLVRLSATQGYIRVENTRILAEEYESLVRKIAAENHPSPFVTSQDFVVEEAATLGQAGPHGSPLPPRSPLGLADGAKDNSKGHIKDKKERTDKGQQDRASRIYDFVKSRTGVSIKDIAAVVRGCSEKTIQRELALLIKRGLVERKGEKRWSLYIPTSSL